MVNYRALAKEVSCCMGCRLPADGTIVLAHRNLLGWGLHFGRGQKTIDLLGAILCRECHSYGDNEGRTDYHWWELAVHRSITWAFDNGKLTLQGNGNGSSPL